LTDPTGKKMGKTEGNMINLDDTPQDIYGKIMSWPDGLIDLGFELCTRVSLVEIEKIKNVPNPRDQKARLAKEIVKMYHGEKEAERAEEEFDKVFRNKEMPTNIPVFNTNKKEYLIVDLLCDTDLASSKKEAKRLIEGGGVEVLDGDSKERVSDWKKEINLENGMIIKVGNRRFVKISIK